MIFPKLKIDFKFRFPTKWNELSPWQLNMIGRILYKNEKFDPKVFVVLLIVVLSMPRPTIKNFFKSSYLLLRIPLTELEGYTNFILDENENLTRFPNSIKAGFKTVYGPAPRLSNVSIEELSYADTFYYNWKTEKKDIDLERLVAVLYRLPKKQRKNVDDIRIEFNKLLLPKRSKLTEKIPMFKMYIVALAYEGSRNVLVSRYKNVFPTQVNSEEKDIKTPKKNRPYQPFSKIITSMVLEETQPFGKLQDASKANAISFLEIYDESIKRQKDLEKRLKSKK